MLLKNIFFKFYNLILKRKFHKTNFHNVKRKYPINRQLEEELKEDEYTRSHESVRAYVWGLGIHGALGYGKKPNFSRPEYFLHKPSRLTFGEQFKLRDVACGFGFSIFITKNSEISNQVFGSGINKDSQIGYHEMRPGHPMEFLYAPAPINIPKNIKRIISAAAGRAHTILLSDTGEVYTFGNNAYGQCGRLIVPDEKYFGNQLINHLKNLPPIKSIECGMDHSLFITKDGQVYSCGLGTDGQTGLSNFIPQPYPKLVGENTEFSQKNIIKVTSSGDCVLALTNDGEVYGWGNNEYGQLAGIEEIQSSTPLLLKLKIPGKIVDIAVGGSFCLILNDKGEVYTWGFGLIGLGPKADHILTPTLIPPPLFGNPIKQIVAGIAHCGAITEKGQLFMWGRNNYGQLGFGNRNNQPYPLAVSVGAQVIKISLGVDHSISLCRAFV